MPDNENTKPEEEDKGCASKDKEKQKDLDPDHKAVDSMVVQSLVFDKEKFSSEEAQKWAEDHNYGKTEVDETESSLRLRQKEPGEFEPDSFRVIEFKPGIQAVIGKIKNPETETPPEEKSNTDTSTKAEPLPAPTPTAPIPTGSQATAPDQNPLLDLQKQQVVLLGALISEIQGLRKQVEVLANPPKEDYETEPETTQETPIPMDNGLQKSIDAIRKNQEDLARRLKKFA